MNPSHSLTLRAEAMRELIVQGVTGDALRAAIVIVEMSFASGMEAAQFGEQRLLALILGWSEDQCSRAIRELRDRRIVHIQRHAGAWWYELRPCGRWQPPNEKLRKTRIPAEKIEAARTAWQVAEAESRRDPDQQDLIARSPDEGKDRGFAAGLLAASREEALERADGRVDGPSTQRENGPLVGGASSQRVDGPSSLAEPQSRARQRTREHVHAPTSVPQSMSHEHEHARQVAGEGENRSLRDLGLEGLESLLDDEGRYWNGQLDEIFGPESARKFRRTWLMRFCDRWRVDAYRAIGETKRKIVSHERFTKGPGECANDLFHRFKHARKAPAMT